MRIMPQGGAGPARERRAVSGATSGSTFRLPEGPQTPPRPTGLAGTASLASLGTLMAVQGALDDKERRRAGLDRGREALDGLDRLRLAILEGRQDGGSIDALRGLLRRERTDTGDAGLERLLDDIDLRAEVELAKLERDAGKR